MFLERNVLGSFSLLQPLTKRLSSSLEDATLECTWLKLGKTSLEINLMVEAQNRYMFNAVPYVGRAPEEPPLPGKYERHVDFVKKK